MPGRGSRGTAQPLLTVARMPQASRLRHASCRRRAPSAPRARTCDVTRSRLVRKRPADRAAPPAVHGDLVDDGVEGACGESAATRRVPRSMASAIASRSASRQVVADSCRATLTANASRSIRRSASAPRATRRGSAAAAPAAPSRHRDRAATRSTCHGTPGGLPVRHGPGVRAAAHPCPSRRTRNRGGATRRRPAATVLRDRRCRPRTPATAARARAARRRARSSGRRLARRAPTSLFLIAFARSSTHFLERLAAFGGGDTPGGCSRFRARFCRAGSLRRSCRARRVGIAALRRS